MDYVLNEHLNFKPTWSICNIISDNIVIQLIWKFQESNWNPDWFIALMDSFDTNYIFTNNKKILANMTKMQYRPRQCHATAILEISLIIIKSLLS